jgi:hypothetical protein
MWRGGRKHFWLLSSVPLIWSSTWPTLKRSCHKIANFYIEFQVIELKNAGLPEHIFIPFWCHFHVFIAKQHALALSYLTANHKWWMTATDHSLPLGGTTCAIDSLIDEGLKHDINCCQTTTVISSSL